MKLNDLIKITMDVCQETLSGLEDVTEKLRLVMKVVSLILLKDEIEIEEETGARGLTEKLLADDVMARINPEAVLLD